MSITAPLEEIEEIVNLDEVFPCTLWDEECDEPAAWFQIATCCGMGRHSCEKHRVGLLHYLEEARQHHAVIMHTCGKIVTAEDLIWERI